MSYNNQNNFNQPMNNQNQVTGSEKFEIKSTPQGTCISGKSSYNDPITGVSESAKVSTEAKDRFRDRSRSSSSERKRKSEHTNLPMRAQETAVNNTIHPVSDFPLNNNNYAQQPYTTSTEMNKNYNNTNMQNQNEYAHEKGKVWTTNHGIMTNEKKEFIDPRTGNQENLEIRTNTRGSGVNTQGKSMHSYENKVQNTPNGPEIEMKEKHREGGMMTNLKNKINNMMH